MYAHTVWIAIYSVPVHVPCSCSQPHHKRVNDQPNARSTLASANQPHGAYRAWRIPRAKQIPSGASR